MADRQDIDALIVGALYGEIDADERARLDAHLSSHPEDRAALEGLQRTRAQVRRGMAEMPALEPSPLISNVLLSAAREAATQGARGAVEPPQQGLWSRFVEWMRPIAGHPAFAAAAVLVLVAGTATAMWMRDKGQASEPQVARQRSVATADESDRKQDEGYREEKAPVTAPEGAATGSSQPLAQEAPALDQLERAKDAEPSDIGGDKAAPRGHGVGGGKVASHVAKGGKPSSDPGMMEVQTQHDELSIKELDAETDNADDSADGDGRDASKSTTSHKPGTAGMAPRPEPAPVDPALEEWAKGKHQQLVKLVADGKCPEAGRLGAQIKDRAPEYYAANVANDRAIRACKSYIEGQAKKKAAKDYKSRAQQNAVDEDSLNSN